MIPGCPLDIFRIIPLTNMSARSGPTGHNSQSTSRRKIGSWPQLCELFCGSRSPTPLLIVESIHNFQARSVELLGWVTPLSRPLCFVRYLQILGKQTNIPVSGRWFHPSTMFTGPSGSSTEELFGHILLSLSSDFTTSLQHLTITSPHVASILSPPTSYAIPISSC